MISRQAVLLNNIAEALTELVQLGERVDVRYSSVMTDHGYVLQGRDGSWEAKLKVGQPPEWWATADHRVPDDE